MRSAEANIIRRLGRVEMLLTELNNLADGYQPTERELEQFAALASKIDAVFFPGKAAPYQVQPKKNGKDKV